MPTSILPPPLGGAIEARAVRFVARWDLDKTYLRTDFDTLRDLLLTAVERPDQKRTVPGAAPLMRELTRSGGEVHILSGSPEQLRSRLTEKLRLDGVRWASLTLKPNLENLLRLRFRALRGQLGYKLPALLRRRCELVRQRARVADAAFGLAQGDLLPEVLLGDDAEADAFVYSLYADVCAGVVPNETLAEVMRKGGAYPDTIADALRFASYVDKGGDEQAPAGGALVGGDPQTPAGGALVGGDPQTPAGGAVVRRILIHLDRQSSPTDFRLFGPRVVPFYNYLQAAFVLQEDGFITAKSVLRVAQDLAYAHNFDSASLARSYLDLSRRGHLTGSGIPDLQAAYADLNRAHGAGASELGELTRELGRMLPELCPKPAGEAPAIDYVAMADVHNRRHRR